MFKKIVTKIILVAVLVTIIPAYGVAGGIERPTEADYQRIVDKVNLELGADIQLASESDLVKLKAQGFTPKERPTDLDQFERELRTTWQNSTIANAEAEQMIRRRTASKATVETGGSGVCRTYFGEMAETKDSTVTRSKSIKGGKAHLKAVVTDESGYWQYKSFKRTWVSWSQGDSTPIYYAEQYKYDWLDRRRTCALSYNGKTLDEYGNIIKTNQKRYVEFWAGNGM